MPRRIFFRDECASVTSTELVIGTSVYPLADILFARGFRRRGFLSLLHLHQYALLITTVSGEREVFRHRNGYLVFQLAKAIETGLRELPSHSGGQIPARLPTTPDTSTFAGSLAT